MKKNIIRKKMSKKAVAVLMAVMIMSSTATNVTFAAEDQTGGTAVPKTKSEVLAEAPDKPSATSHKDNGKIEEYNKKVDAYNESARQYNESVDRNYDAAVEETGRMNAEIDRHNASEQQRVKDAGERNAQAQKAADEENLRIDAENEAEKSRVDQFNRDEDAKAAAAAEARAAAEATNEEVREHNARVEKYKEDLEQYKKDLAQYEYDLRIEAQILGLGYGSVQQYNDAIERAYNTPAKKSVEKNASAKELGVKDTYTVKEAAEKSGRTVTVHVEHNFQGIGLSYTEDFEIDANDIITFSPISAAGEQTSPGYATFYYNTDDQHKMGYWMEAYSSVGSNARHNVSDWNCGDTHEISYKDGKNHAFDKEEIVVEYNYMWNPLKVYKTYNTPSAPVEPENPGQAREFVDVPELYAPNYQTFEAKQHVKAELEEIKEAAIWENITDPVKEDYMSLIDYMDLFAVPKAAEAKAASSTAVSGAGHMAVNTEAVSDSAVPMTIMDSETPQAAASGAWALINLLSAIVTALLSLIMMVRYFRAGREENEERIESRKGIFRLASMIPAVGAIAAFIITENMANPMVLTDRWTAMMIIILAVQAVIALLAAKKNNDNEEAMGNA